MLSTLTNQCNCLEIPLDSYATAMTSTAKSATQSGTEPAAFSGFAQQTPSNNSASKPLSSNALIGILLGSVLGAVAVAGVGYFFLRRKRGRDGAQQIFAHARKDRGTAGRGTTRAELEGPLEGISGAGIYVRKPELEGTDCMSGGARGPVYVRGKAELEGSPYEVSELEARPLDEAGEIRVLASSLMNAGPSRSEPG
ncbi:hypothetical protein F4804DRAFT_297831 [Jackrogersella minutella]|nr:hypothetical protein F4804DRAFT_297831 [Jackrogersella minutella]